MFNQRVSAAEGRGGSLELCRRVAVSLSVLGAGVLILSSGTLYASRAHASSDRPIVERQPRTTDQVRYELRVSYRDLDLRRADDVDILKRRLRVAAGKLCHESPEMVAIGSYFSPNCRIKALSDGRRQIDLVVAKARSVTASRTLADDAAASGAVAKGL